jgi:hypothetical protein
MERGYTNLSKESKLLILIESNSEIPKSYYSIDQCVMFDVGVRVENDFLVRARHFKGGPKGRVSIFRAFAHTSFVNNNVMRLQRCDLDLGSSDHVYPSDFFLDLIFTDARNQSNVIMNSTAKSKETLPE